MEYAWCINSSHGSYLTDIVNLLLHNIHCFCFQNTSFPEDAFSVAVFKYARKILQDLIVLLTMRNDYSVLISK